MKKRLLSLLLAAAMTVSLVACGGNSSDTGDQQENPQGEDAGNEEPTAEIDITAPYEETVNLKVAVSMNQAIEYQDGDDVYNNPWTRAFKERYNIEVEPAFVSEDSEYNTKINLAIAEQDIPDIFVVSYSQLQQLVEADMVYDLKDIFDKYANDSIKSFMEADDWTAYNSAMFDGKLYGIPQLTSADIVGYFNNIWIRKDWMEEQNLSAPETMDEMVEMARIFAREYGCTGIALEQSLTSLNILAPAWGAYPGNWIEDETGQIVYGSVQPEMKEALAEWASWYEEGLLDENFATMDNAMVDTADVSGEIGIRPYYDWWGYAPGINEVENLGMDAVRLPYAIPSANGEQVKYPVPGATAGAFIVVSKDCEHPEAVMKLLNFHNYIVYGDTSEEDSEFIEALVLGSREHIMDKMRIVNPEEGRIDYEYTKAAVENQDISYAENANSLVYYTEIVDFLNGSSSGTGGYTLTYPEISSFAIAISLIDEGAYIRNELGEVQPEILANSGTTLGDILLEGFTKIIMGTEPIDYFDTLVEDWMTAGGEQATTEMNELYGNQ